MEKNTEQKGLASENAHLRKEVELLREKVEHLRNEMLRLISRNLDLSEQLETNIEFRRRALVAKEILSINIGLCQNNPD